MVGLLRNISTVPTLALLTTFRGQHHDLRRTRLLLPAAGPQRGLRRPRRVLAAPAAIHGPSPAAALLAARRPRPGRRHGPLRPRSPLALRWPAGRRLPHRKPRPRRVDHRRRRLRKAGPAAVDGGLRLPRRQPSGGDGLRRHRSGAPPPHPVHGSQRWLHRRLLPAPPGTNPRPSPRARMVVPQQDGRRRRQAGTGDPRPRPVGPAIHALSPEPLRPLPRVDWARLRPFVGGCDRAGNSRVLHSRRGRIARRLPRRVARAAHLDGPFPPMSMWS